MPNDAITPFTLILNRGATSPPGRSQRCSPRRFATASPRCADPGKLNCRIRIWESADRAVTSNKRGNP